MSTGRSIEPHDDLAADRLELALRTSNIGLWDFDLRSGDLATAPLHSFNVWEPLGYDTTHDVRFEDRRTLWHPEDRDRVGKAITDYLASDATEFRIEARVLHSDGTYRGQLSRGTALRDANGRPTRFIGTTEDVTAFHQTENALRATQDRLRGTFENAPIGMCETDLEARFIWVNQRLCDITGYSPEELIGKTAYELTHPDDLAPMRARAAAFVDRSTQRYANQKRYRRKDGSYVWVEVALSMVRGPDGNPRYAIGTIQDVSRRRELEDELVLAKEQAVAANRAKDEFLANVSHEIRTPMNAIVGMTELVLDTQLAPGQRQSLDTVRAAAQNLLGIIEDLLDFSRIESRKLVLDDVPFSLRVAIDETVRALAMRAHRKGLELVYEVAADVPDAVTGDARRLRQILLNLIGNAIKFTHAGEVVVTVARSELGIKVAVRDSGIGIPADKQALIFQAFEQADTSTTRVYGGTGLGLTIATQLIALMGGTIAVESEPGRGSTFTFTAQLAAQPRAIATTAPASQPDPVLVVDDHATVRELAASWLRAAGIQAVTVASAAEAVTVLGRERFAVVFLDAQLPDAADVARASAEGSVVLMTTADSRLEPFEPSRLRGQLRKPLAEHELIEAVAPGTEGTVASAPAAAAAPAPIRVLVAEDNEFNAQLLQQLLARRGHEVHVTRNGRDALDAARTLPFDAMLLDLHMPELDGVQVIEAIRADERSTGRHLPVIALTARSRAEDRVRCLEAGMDEFLTKPTRAAELWEALDRVVRSVPPLSVIDARVLRAACGDDSVLLERICRTLNARLFADLAAAEAAHRELDAATLREVAHGLYGMVSAFSSMAGNIASRIEEKAESSDLEAAGFWLGQLVGLAPQLLQAVEGISLDRLRG